MSISRYALVTYIRSPIGEFVERLRQELHPTTAHLAAHLTILPPRELQGSEQAAADFLKEACLHADPFSVELGDVATFLPRTPTVFIEVKKSASLMKELHNQVCGGGLDCEEPWPYTPHLTILKADNDDQARAAYEIAQARWSKFVGQRKVEVAELVFVREQDGSWCDIAPVPLGRRSLERGPTERGLARPK